MYSSEVSPGDVATASQYNNSRKDAIVLGGDIATTTGSSNSYAVSIDSAIDELVDGMVVKFIANHDNTGTATLNVNLIGAIDLVLPTGDPLAGGEIITSSLYSAIYDDGAGVFWLVGIQLSGGTISEVTSGTQSMAINTTYIANYATEIVFTLPDTAAVGDTVTVVGKGAGGYRIAQNSGETINDGAYTSTSGTSGFWLVRDPYESVTLRCVTANTVWTVERKTGFGTVDTALGVDDPYVLGSAISTAAKIGCYTDDKRFFATIEITAGGTLSLFRGAVSYEGTATPYYHVNSVRQSVAVTTILAASTPYGRPIIKDGVLYVKLGGAGVIYGCPIGTSITVGGNWTAYTESGFPTTAHPVGWAQGYFWFKSISVANAFYRATLSGTTFTYVDTISVTTGSTTTPHFNFVNDKGIFVFTNLGGGSTTPNTKFSSLAGTNDTSRHLEVNMYGGTRHSGYAKSISASPNNIIKVLT